MESEKNSPIDTLVEFRGKLFDQRDVLRRTLQERVCGIKIKPVLSLTTAVEKLDNTFRLRVPGLLREKAEAAIALYPLLQRAARGEKLTARDIRPYRSAIKDLHEGAKWADLGLGCLSFFPPAWIATVPTRITLHRKIERGFIEAIPEILEHVKDYAVKAYPYVEYIAGFENPRQQFQEEVKYLVDTVIDNANTLRGAQKNLNESELAGKAIHQTLEKIINEDEEISANLSLIRGLVFPLLPDDVSIPNSKMLGVVSPEIVGALERVLPEEDRTGYRNRLEKQLHPLRESFLVSMFAGGKIMTLNKQLPMLFLSLREILPTNGLRFRNEFLEQARIFGADLNDKSAS